VNLAVEHLRLCASRLHGALACAIEERGGAQAVARAAGGSALFISAAQARQAAAVCEQNARADGAAPFQPDPEFEWAEAALRRRGPLPLDALQEALQLSDFERWCVVLCAMTEIDRGYERIFAFLQDDLGRTMPGPALAAELLEGALDRRIAARQRLGRYARLRRRGVIEEVPQPYHPADEMLRAAPLTLSYLAGQPAEPAALFRDAFALRDDRRLPLPDLLDRETLEALSAAIRERRLSLIAFWGMRHAHVEEAVRQTSAAVGLPVFRCPATFTSETECHALMDAAWCEQAAVWLDCDALFAEGGPRAKELWSSALRQSPVPVFLTGQRPWRATEFLDRGEYWEMELAAPAFEERTRHWNLLLPGSRESDATGLAGRFRMSWSEMQAAVRLAASSGLAAEPRKLEEACSLVLRRESAQFAEVITPRRGPEHLVLPDALTRQIHELSKFYLARSRVYESWGFDSVVTGGGGIKAFFSGEPGTGKTLAAEAVAKMVGLPLLKVDLSRLVSKWVGETEKHLERVFTEAEESHYVLLLDECDSLGSKRGEVRTGSDKYANLETAYLLQRLESFHGLAILASNLKEQMDDALLRRFQIVIHFALPAAPERLRIWQMALAHGAPLEPGLRLEPLAQLEMTGAAIVNCATMSAMLAASEGRSAIGVDHLMRAIARQFQRESRILNQHLVGEIGAQIRAVM
jgi:hypothetical protein